MEITKVFVIIVTYNGKQWYDRCFGSLRASEMPVNVVVIDNASSDDTVSYIQTNFPEIHIITSEINLGFGQGNNRGIRYAMDHGADYVFLLNQDAWIEPNTLTGLVEVYKKNTEYGILSPMHLDAHKSCIEKGLLVFLTYHEHINLELISDFYMGLKKEVYDVREVNAAAWLLPRRTLETVGGFDPIFFHYAEDDNYLSRVLYHELKIGLVPLVTICHDTERPLVKTKEQDRNFDKWLLQRATNLIYPQTVDQQISSYLKEAFRKIIFLNFYTAKANLSNALYLVRMRKRVLQSREKNKNKGETWL